MSRYSQDHDSWNDFAAGIGEVGRTLVQVRYRQGAVPRSGNVDTPRHEMDQMPDVAATGTIRQPASEKDCTDCSCTAVSSVGVTPK